MHKKVFFWALLTIGFIANSNSFAQLNDYRIKGGFQGFGLLPDMEFANDDIKASYLARAFLRIKLIDMFDLELGGGYGMLAGDDPLNMYWQTTIIPFDAKFLLSPFDFKSINPYGYAGAGFMKWKVNDKPSYSNNIAVEDDGFDLFVPIGLGLEIKVTNSLLIDISGGYNFVFTDDLNYYNNIDSPNDGANDGYWNLGLGLIFTGESGNSDSDMDGMTYDEETELGTDPHIADTDSDGLLDGLEVKQYNTDPFTKDSDKDGLSDSDEIKQYTTNPNSSDTDNDQLNDGDEILNYKTDPLRSDSDFDGISDYKELTNTHTDPTKPDSDDDGLKDGDEINKYKTSPTEIDTDGDEISDGDEIFKYNTNPSQLDTDGGSTNDYIEISRGSNPLNPEDDIILEISESIVLKGINFTSGSSELTAESENMLLVVLNTLNAYPKITFEIKGYTDNVGSNSNNLRLSQKRANSVRYWLLNKGIAPKRIIAKGYGEESPIADNSTKEGRQQNRRIEFVKTN